MSRIDPARVSFEPMTARHLPIMAGWLRQPHVREWWGDPDEELQKVRDMIEGRDTTRPFAILFDGETVGYIQVWYTDDWRDPETLAAEPWVALLPKGVVGVDLTIGVAELVSRGVGSAALSRFVAMLRAEGCETIIIDPDPANARAVRAYEKAGFRPVPHLLGRTEGVLIMQHEP